MNKSHRALPETLAINVQESPGATTAPANSPLPGAAPVASPLLDSLGHT